MGYLATMPLRLQAGMQSASVPPVRVFGDGPAFALTTPPPAATVSHMPLKQTTQFSEAHRLMLEGGPFTFITGRAGTGKSTLLKHFRETTSLIAPVLAPTGVAALNVDGETIHRFFRFSPGITVKDARKKGSLAIEPGIYRNADLLIIDEISMVRADLIDCMDQFLRAIRKSASPFGGLRIVAIGDLYQLPPVIASVEREAFSQLYDSPYFFASRVMRELLAAGEVSFVELETVYRQSDPAFIAFLNGVRDKTVSEGELARLNTRVGASQDRDAITLTSVNALADEANRTRLDRLRGREETFRGTFTGDFPEREAPAPSELRLKVGARVMCLCNDQANRYVNGSLGHVVGFNDAAKGGAGETVEGAEAPAPEPSVIVNLDEGATVSISPHTWTVYRSGYDRATNTLDREKVGSFMQVPLKLAWAVTIHKSQGKTFDRVTIDLGDGAFTTGQAYVALSRCRSLDGLSLRRPIRPQDIRLDRSVVEFMRALRGGTPLVRQAAMQGALFAGRDDGDTRH